MNEKTIIEEALLKVNAQPGLTAKWKPQPGDIDGILDIKIHNRPVKIFAEVKNELRVYQLEQLLANARRHKPFMVIADNIFPRLKEALRAKNIGYLDTAGNLFITAADQLVWIDGQKKEKEKKTTANRAFTKAGLKVVFYLLLHKDAIQLPYRQLAFHTGVALGNINNVIEGLAQLGFILDFDKKRKKLNNRRHLLERWIEAYGQILKPALLRGRYHFFKQEAASNWEALPIRATEDTWGGEPAAEKLTRYLSPREWTLYTHRPKAEVAKALKLVPDPNGNVLVYEKFWKQEGPETFAPPLLVYADLKLTHDPRCLETAEKIFKEYLHEDFAEHKGR